MSTGNDFVDVRTAARRLAARAYTEAVDREKEHRGVGDLVPELLASGIGRLRVPRRYGGVGGSVAELGSLLLELATAESNLVQVIRGHLGFVELLLQREDDPAAEELLAAAGRGEFFGPAASSPPPVGSVAVADDSTRALTGGVHLHDDGTGLRLTGVKYYTTGSLYADWINVLVQHGDDFVEVVVARDAPGVTVVDDWNGFGQRMTASGTTTFDGVPVREDLVLKHRDPELSEYLGAFYQWIHSVTQAGIVQRASEDVAALVRGRRRSYPLAPDPEPRHDAQVLSVVGEVASRAFTTRATVSALAVTIDQYLVAGGDERRPALEQAVVESAQTQVVNSRLAGEVGWSLFDAASASAVDLELALDRHWRNARTVSSHNPSIYKARLVGDFAVNGTLPGPAFVSAPEPERVGV